MTIILLMNFYIIGCVFALYILSIYLYEITNGNLFNKKITKNYKKIIITILLSWLTVIIQCYKIKKL